MTFFLESTVLKPSKKLIKEEIKVSASFNIILHQYSSNSINSAWYHLLELYRVSYIDRITRKLKLRREEEL